MKVQLLRHATLLVIMNGKKILVDPMLSKKDALDPVPNAANTGRFPLVDWPEEGAPLQQLVQEADMILVTHTHRDHWDVAAQQMIPKDKLVVCQPQDQQKIKDQGFEQVDAVREQMEWSGIHCYRTGGQHGTGEIGALMAPVSGFVLKHQGESLYIAGDTIWCPEVQEAIDAYRPDHIVVNSGAAQFLKGGPITMTADDVINTALYAPQAQVYAVHLETVNHCYLLRPQLAEAIHMAGLSSRVHIPADGAWFL